MRCSWKLLCWGGEARRVAEVSASSERDVLGEGTPERGSHLEELPQLLAGGLQALEAMLGTGKSHAGVLQRRQLAALHRPAGHGDELGV